MAVDEDCLRWVSRGTDRLVFRTYGWERPTLSLGRSEPFPLGWNEAALEREGIDVVRRPTGGTAVLHVEEVTFAIAASLPGPWAFTPRGFANAVADALVQAIRRCGVEEARVAVGPPLAKGSERTATAMGTPAAVCFARSAPGEVTAGGYKVAGLASRFGRRGALCHASVPVTAVSREVARFRTGSREAKVLEENARSLTELLSGEGSRIATIALAEMLQARLLDAIAERFSVSVHPASFEDLGILLGEPVTA